MATLSSSLQVVTRKQPGVCSVQYLLEHVGEVDSDLQGSSTTQQVADQDCTLGFQLHSGVEAGNVGHSAGDSVCSGGVLGSGTQSAQRQSGGERL